MDKMRPYEDNFENNSGAGRHDCVSIAEYQLLLEGIHLAEDDVYKEADP
jgi:hypothetical protein